MFERPIVVYGTGGDAKETVMDKKIRDRILCAVGRDDHDGKDSIKGIPLKNDSYLNEIGIPFDLIIASQYFDKIHRRLQNEGKLINKNLIDIYVPNLMGRKPPYDPAVRSRLSSDEWQWLEDNVEPDLMGLLGHLREEREAETYPSREYVALAEGFYHAGYEDYWETVKGKRTHEKVVVVDAGAYTGDTIDGIVENIGGRADAYYALEPMKENFETLSRGSYRNVKNFYPLCCALGKEEGEAVFSNSEDHKDAFSINRDSAYMSGGIQEEQRVRIVTLDSLLLTEGADYFVKMDIEGSEMEALRGGIDFIKEMRPNLAVCLYHKTRDLIEIPKFVKGLRPDYELHLVGGSHTIMIAK